jgi:Protein of unknown function (DUF3168)
MTVIEGLRAYLLAGTEIAALVATRIYPLRLPQKIDISSGKAAIVLQRIDEIDDAHLRGPNALKRARIQVDCYAVTHDAATALGALVRRRINGFRGSWDDGASPPATLTVQAILEEQEADRFENEIGGGLCRHMADYIVFYVTDGETVLI